MIGAGAPSAAAPGARRTVAAGAAAAAAYMAIAHVPVGGGWLPPAAALAAALAAPRFAPALCVGACMVQDAPGLAPDAARAAVAGCGLVHLATGGLGDLRRSGRWLACAVASALVAILVASAVSLAGWLGWGFEQSPSRPWALVAAADAAMVLVGASIGATAARDAGAAQRVAGAACAGLAVIALRIAGQCVGGPLTGFSAIGAATVSASDQLMGRSPTGVIRYVGSMLTPNAMAMAACFAVLLAWPWLGRRRAVAGLSAAGLAIAAAVFGGTKSSLLVALAITLVLPGPLAGCALLAIVAAWAAVDPGVREWLQHRFRTSSPVRDLAYGAGHTGLRTADALLGMGLSHWPVFYQRAIGQPMADPHSALFSYPWTYGVAGVVALGAAVAGLVRALRAPAATRGLALVLLSVLLVRDMFTIPLLIGASVLTLLLWILLAQVLARPACAEGTP